MQLLTQFRCQSPLYFSFHIHVWKESDGLKIKSIQSNIIIVLRCKTMECRVFLHAPFHISFHEHRASYNARQISNEVTLSKRIVNYCFYSMSFQVNQNVFKTQDEALHKCSSIHDFSAIKSYVDKTTTNYFNNNYNNNTKNCLALRIPFECVLYSPDNF